MNNCVEHDWSWDDDDYGCPVCYGAQDERERIIALLEADCADGIGDKIQGCFHEVTKSLLSKERTNE